MKYSFVNYTEEYNKEHPQGSKSDWFKFQEGPNKIRVLSKGEVIAEHFKLGTCFGIEKGCPYHTKEYESNPSRPKWLMWIIDRSDEKIKLAKMPYTIIQAIADLQKNEDYSFDEIPMPYDITITANGAGTKEVKYTVMPSIKRIQLSEQEEKEFGEQTTVEEIVQKLKNKQMEKVGLDPEVIAKREEIKREFEANTNTEPKEKTIDYPEDEINPEEIPF